MVVCVVCGLLVVAFVLLFAMCGVGCLLGVGLGTVFEFWWLVDWLVVLLLVSVICGLVVVVLVNSVVVITSLYCIVLIALDLLFGFILPLCACCCFGWA